MDLVVRGDNPVVVFIFLHEDGYYGSKYKVLMSVCVYVWGYMLVLICVYVYVLVYTLGVQSRSS